MSSSPPKTLQAPNPNHTAWLLRRVWERINRRNLHFMFCIVGEEGSGKSQTAIRIASEVDPSFNADRVIFDVSELLGTLKDGDHEPGNFYVLDEAGVQFGRRTWQQRGQVLANQALQLVRDHNLGLIFTLPRLGELDSQAQGRLQGVLELIDKEDGEHVTGKWKWCDPDRMDETGKIYKPYPKRRTSDGVIRLTRVSLKPPSQKLVEPYQERKRVFQEEFYQETMDALDDGGGEDEDDTVDPREVYEEIRSNGGVEPYTSVHGGHGNKYIDADLIELEFDCSMREAKKVKKLLEKDEDMKVEG